jgi:hypothetical protein
MIIGLMYNVGKIMLLFHDGNMIIVVVGGDDAVF